ncbi:hypothetical protein HDU76_008561, partial [Blyttiomyces sp. JEL0837]
MVDGFGWGSLEHVVVAVERRMAQVLTVDNRIIPITWKLIPGIGGVPIEFAVLHGDDAKHDLETYFQVLNDPSLPEFVASCMDILKQFGCEDLFGLKLLIPSRPGFTVDSGYQEVENFGEEGRAVVVRYIPQPTSTATSSSSDQIYTNATSSSSTAYVDAYSSAGAVGAAVNAATSASNRNSASSHQSYRSNSSVDKYRTSQENNRREKEKDAIVFKLNLADIFGPRSGGGGSGGGTGSGLVFKLDKNSSSMGGGGSRSLENGGRNSGGHGGDGIQIVAGRGKSASSQYQGKMVVMGMMAYSEFDENYEHPDSMAFRLFTSLGFVDLSCGKLKVGVTVVRVQLFGSALEVVVPEGVEVLFDVVTKFSRFPENAPVKILIEGSEFVSTVYLLKPKHGPIYSTDPIHSTNHLLPYHQNFDPSQPLSVTDSLQQQQQLYQNSTHHRVKTTKLPAPSDITTASLFVHEEKYTKLFPSHWHFWASSATVHLDLTDAVFQENGTVRLTLELYMSGVEIVVPEGLKVEVRCK